MNTIEINGLAFELDFLDAAVAERVEGALEKVKTRTAEIAEAKGLKMSESIRATCVEIFECFNTILGEGADKKVFGERTNLAECMEAFGQLSSQIISSSRQQMTDMNKKYLPNREARRAAARK